MDIQETRNAYERATQTFTAKVCACGEPMQPELLNITIFNDTLPRWTIGWLCPYYLQATHNTRMKDNKND